MRPLPRPGRRLGRFVRVVLPWAVLSLAACGGAPAALTTSTQAPTASAIAATTRPSPSVAPRPQDAAIAAFVDRVTAGDLRYRMSFKGRTALAVDSLPTIGTVDVDGEDFASSFTYDFEPRYPGTGKIRVQVRAIDGTAWAKIGSGKWTALSSWRESDTNIPFHAIDTVRDVKYLGTEERAGATVYRVHVPEANLIDPSTIPGALTDEQVQRRNLELLIDEAGTPLAGSWELKGRGRVGGGQLQEILYQLELTFSKVGEKITISKP